MSQTISTIYGADYLVLGTDKDIVWGTAMLDNQFGTIKQAMVKRTGERELIINSAGELKLILIKTPGFELMLQCAFDASVVAPGMGESLSLPLVGVTGFVMEGATVAWEQGGERGLMIPVSSWDSFRNVSAYRLSPSTGERLSIGPVGLVAPSNSTVIMAVPTSISAALTWSAIARASLYELQVRNDSEDAWSALVTTANQSYTHFGLLADTSRQYRLRGTNAAGEGPWSDPVTVETDAAAPATAPVISAYVESGSYDFNVLLTDVVGAEEYEYQRSAGGGIWATIAVTADTFVAEDIGAGVTRLYRARALNSVGSGPWSATISVTSTSMGAPILSVVQSGEAMVLTWAGADFDALALATSFEVQFSADSGATWSTMATTTGNTASDSSIALDTTRMYRVRAVNSTENGPWSDTRTATRTGLGTPAVTGQSLERAASLRYTWLPVAGATGYEIELNTAADFAGGSSLGLFRSLYGQITVSPSLISANLSSLTTGAITTNTTYYARARITTNAGTGPWSTAVTLTTCLAAITDVTWSGSIASWTAPAGAPDSYRVYAAIAQPNTHVYRNQVATVTGTSLDTDPLASHVDPGQYAYLEIVPVKNGLEGLPFSITAINP